MTLVRGKQKGFIMKNYSEISDFDDSINKENLDEIKKIEDKEIKKNVMGIVDCELLNIRYSPSVDSNLVTSPIKKGTKVQIDYDNSPEFWFHIYLPSGIDGYVMRDYIVIDK